MGSSNGALSEPEGRVEGPLQAFDQRGIVGWMPWVYILRCADGTLYTGHTKDLASREAVHNAGHGAEHTAARCPVRLVYSEEHDSTHSAIRRERQLKRGTIRKKEALIAGDLATLKRL
jgi:putative endonuclease